MILKIPAGSPKMLESVHGNDDVASSFVEQATDKSLEHPWRLRSVWRLGTSSRISIPITAWPPASHLYGVHFHRHSRVDDTFPAILGKNSSP